MFDDDIFLARWGVLGIFFTPIGGAVIMQARHKIFIPEYCIWNCGRGRGYAVNTEWAHHATFFFFLVHHELFLQQFSRFQHDGTAVNVAVVFKSTADALTILGRKRAWECGNLL
jgi:hypothetical protein